VEPYIVAEATTIVVAQRLLRRNCPRCAIEHKIPVEVLRKIGVAENVLGEFTKVKKGEGCEDCGGTGLKGRMAIFELLTMSASVKEAIYRNGSPIEIKRMAMKDGMRTLRQAALLKLRAGMTTVEEVLNTTVADIV
jgi:type IV pilus assembly protein PilB